MAKSLYVAAAEAESGKGLVALGVTDWLSSKTERVGFFRPILAGPPQEDTQIRLMNDRYCQHLRPEQMFGVNVEWAKQCLLAGKRDTLVKTIIERFEVMQSRCEFSVCDGTEFRGSAMPFDFPFNLEIAGNLESVVVPVVGAKTGNVDAICDSVGLAWREVTRSGVGLAAMVVNRVTPADQNSLTEVLRRRFPNLPAPLFTLVANEALERPTVADIVRQVRAEVLWGDLNREVRDIRIAAMTVPNFLARLSEGSLVVTPGDRADIILACLATALSERHPQVAGLMLTGGLLPGKPVLDLIEGMERFKTPVISVPHHTFSAAQALQTVEPAIEPDNDSRIAAALNVFESGVEVERIATQLHLARPQRITPVMFEHRLTGRAKQKLMRIVLPEGREERILRATEILLMRKVVEVTLLGDPAAIESKATSLGVDIEGAQIVNPLTAERRQTFADTYYELRKHKGMTPAVARDVMTDVSYFGTMMVHEGQADGMVSGSVHTTQHTIRPSFEIIKTMPGVSVVSSVFFMCLRDRVLVYGDCAVNPNPDAEQLADIAIASAETAAQFGVEPRVAMLSYSTGASGKGSDVDRVREATRIARERRPDLPLDGPIQYDAAIDASVAQTKLPDSQVAGRATVFIFPDLNTGNNTYKAVQRSAGAVAIGPVLQGLKKPVNDLSRGCTVVDIINTVAITAIQAQQAEQTRMAAASRQFEPGPGQPEPISP